MHYGFEAAPCAVVGGNSLDYAGNGFRSVPTSMVMAGSKGSWKVAFSLLVPTQFKYGGQMDWYLSVDGHPLQAEGPSEL